MTGRRTVSLFHIPSVPDQNLSIADVRLEDRKTINLSIMNRTGVKQVKNCNTPDRCKLQKVTRLRLLKIQHLSYSMLHVTWITSKSSRNQPAAVSAYVM